MVKAKTFILALSLFSSHPNKSKRFLEDKRLTRAEKSILRGYFLLRDLKFEEVKQLLSSIGDIADPVVRSQYHFLMGLVYNNQNEYKSALTEIKFALKYLPADELRAFEFNAHLNLFIIHFNLRNVPEMKNELEFIRDYQWSERNNIKNILRLHSCEYLYYSYIGKQKVAGEILDRLDQYKDQMTEVDIVSHLIHRFKHSIEINDIEKARNVLVEMKDYRKFSISENYRYMKKLLDHYTDRKPLYFKDEEFEKQPVLLCYIKVIQLLEERKNEEAMEWWAKLAQRYPDTFHEAFRYTGQQNIFSLCLNLYADATATPSVIDIDENLNRGEAIILFLEKANGPVSRNALFKFLWKRDAVHKEDFVRLSRKIYRLKKQFSIDIEYRKGCYLLVQSKKTNAA